MAQHKKTRTSSKRHTSNKSMKTAAAPRRTRSSAAKRVDVAAPNAVGDEEVTIDRRRGGRRGTESKAPAKASPAAPKLERREKVNRRRQIDPTTCERDYTDQEVEFMNALDDYKRKSGRMFPTCSEVLEVIRSLGYAKLSPAEAASRSDAGPSTTSAKPMPADWSSATNSSESTADGIESPAQEPHLSCC